VDGDSAGGGLASPGEQAMIIGMTSGCFDLIHYGHIHYLQRCRVLCDRLVVAVDSDEMVWAAKGPSRPIIPEIDRLRLLNSLNCVDIAFIMRDLVELEDAAYAFHVDRLFKHQGFRRPERVFGTGSGAELVIVPDVEGLESTTAIIKRVREKAS
jgi:cytidyltransferase-like protein